MITAQKRLRRNTRHKNSAFTLFEMLVVVGIIIAVTAILLPSFVDFIATAGMNGAQSTLNSSLTKTRSLAANQHRMMVLVFEREDYIENYSTWVDHRSLDEGDQLGIKELEKRYTGKLRIYDIESPGKSNTFCRKKGGSVVLPSQVTFEFAPDFCVFYPDGTMGMGYFSTHEPGTIGGPFRHDSDISSSAEAIKTVTEGVKLFKDALSATFKRNVTNNVRDGLEIEDRFTSSPEFRLTPPYDVKLVRTGGGGQAKYINLLMMTGRIGKSVEYDR